MTQTNDTCCFNITVVCNPGTPLSTLKRMNPTQATLMANGFKVHCNGFFLLIVFRKFLHGIPSKAPPKCNLLSKKLKNKLLIFKNCFHDDQN
jgi:hypothetical protein